MTYGDAFGVDMSQRTRSQAEFLYPGSFFPESQYVDLPNNNIATAIENQPSATEGYFVKDGWYAVVIKTLVEKRFTADDGEITWVLQADRTRRKSYIVGKIVHVDDIPDEGIFGDAAILKSNIRSNSRKPLKGYGVLTRRGNWQIASDWDEILTDEEARG